MADMDAVFSNHDLVVNLLLYSILEDYRERGPGCPQTHSPDEMAKKVRVELRSLLVTLNATSRVNRVFHQATAPAVWALLEEVNRQFTQMRFKTLLFLLEQPYEYDGIRLPIVQRSDAILIYPNLEEGREALEVVRACFEEPFGTSPEPLLGHGCDFQRASFGRRCLTAGHWVRRWVHELLWIAPPVEDVESLWLALHRGCSVCGRVCQCATRSAMLKHAATNADLTSPLLPNHPTTQSSAPADSIYTRLHARIEVPWDLAPVNGVYMLPMTLGEPMSVNNDPIEALSTSIWMYTHPDHIVTVQLYSNEYKFVVDETTTPPSTSIEAHVHMELLLARMNNLCVDRTKGGTFARWLIAQLADKRMHSIRSSGLRDNILKHGANVHPQMAQYVFDWPDHFHASLPLFPAHGKLRSHSWMHVLGLTEHEFLEASWQSSLPLPPTTSYKNLTEEVAVEEAEAWRGMALRRAIMALSEALPNRRTAFHRGVEFLHPDHWYDGLGRENPSRVAPTVTVTDLAILVLGQLAETESCARDDNWTLLETWEPLKQLKDGIFDKGEAFQNVLRLYQTPHAWHHQRLPADPEMIAYFCRLDSVLGMAWKHVARIEEESFHRHTSPSTRQIELRDVAVEYLNGTTMAPPSPWDTPVFGGIPPPAPRHPDVLMRWWLLAMTHPSVTRPASGRAEDPWPCPISLDLHNTFVVTTFPSSASFPSFQVPRSDPLSCGMLAVHLSLSVTSDVVLNVAEPASNSVWRKQHRRITMGIELTQLLCFFYWMDKSTVNVKDALDGTSKELRLLDSWHQEATRCCKALTEFAQMGHGRNALWLLHSILDTHWTPVLDPPKELDVFRGHPRSWTKGWRALSSLCTSKSAWFADIHGPVPFCKWRGQHRCVCFKKCVF
tara:strand:+ start:1351 stop:4032 length:2682 start_codon:yes stop_codon:yes gene_type:complete